MSEQHVNTVRSTYDAFKRGDIPGVLANLEQQIEFQQYTDTAQFVRAVGN